MDPTTLIIFVVLGLVAVAATTVAVFLARQQRQHPGIAMPAVDVTALVERARQEAESESRRLLLEAKDEALRLRQEAEQEARDQRKEFGRLEERLLLREEALDHKIEAQEQKESELRTREDDMRRLQEEARAGLARQQAELERLAGLSGEQAKELLLRKLDGELQHEKSLMVKRHEQETREQAERKAQDILSQVIQRCAVDHVVESTVSVVSLPNDEMKGRIIGREGRNIRAFEALTGVDLIIDDTPEAVVLSSFDPVRREVARLSLEKLIGDGRIHPTRIEESIAKSRKEVEAKIREAGEQAIFEAEMHGVHPEIVQLLGRLKYRTSYGQNVLAHSLECAYLASILAAELKADIHVAKRGALLHDLGKALTHEREGPHALIGAEVAQKYQESRAVVHCIAAHHCDEEPETLEAVLVQIADAISATRPGARREQVEVYLRRMHKLEEIAASFAGIDRAYAIQAGREVRIVVHPESVDDAGASLLAREVANKVEQELEYPGQVKVTVVRETRAVDYAK